jgi:hypothetical protein
LYECEYKGVAGKAIRKVMKTKGEQSGVGWSDAEANSDAMGLTCGNMGQGIMEVKITEGLSIERRNPALSGRY